MIDCVDHIIFLVFLYCSSFVIFLGHFTFNIFLTIFSGMYQSFSPFFVNIHNGLLYRNMEAVYTLKQLCFVFSATGFDLYMFSFFL